MKNFKGLIIAGLMSTAINANGQQAQDSIQYGGWERFRIGGYGEMVAARKDYGSNRFYGSSEGNVKEGRATISIPRLVLAGDYKFNTKWTLGIEIEFESGGVGTAYELENSENGEYETEVERGGEVAIEQFHITRLFCREFNIRAGHVVLPVGQNNAHHEPNQFFGTVRPEGETTIIPNTWHETGIELFGTIGKKYATFDYRAFVTTGLNANGFERNTWAGKAKQGIFEEENFSCPAFTARVDWRGIKGLRLGGAIYYCADIGANADKKQTYAGIGNCPIIIYNVDGQYKNQFIETRANFLWGNLSNAAAISAKNTKLSNKSPYSRLTPIAKRAVAFGGEFGLNIKGIVNDERCPLLYPFARYEYYNSQEKVEAPYNADNRCKVSMWTAGVNYRVLPQVVVKADYTTRNIGGGKYNNENEFAIGMAWTGWFFKK